MKIEHIIFLIHPCCYEGLDAEAVRQDNLYLYVELENEVKARWLAALSVPIWTVRNVPCVSARPIRRSRWSARVTRSR